MKKFKNYIYSFIKVIFFIPKIIILSIISIISIIIYPLVKFYKWISNKYNFKRLFAQQKRVKDRIYKKSNINILKSNYFIFSILCVALSLIIMLSFKDKTMTECSYRFVLALLFGSFLNFFIFLFVSFLDEIFKCTIAFVFIGASIFFVVNLCFFALLLVITKNVIISYYLMIFLMVVLWSYISTLDNLEVAKMGNGIISAFVTLGLEFTGNLRGTLVFNDPDIMNAIVISKNVWKILLFPFVAATLIGLISCEYKEYWIKRNGKSKEIYTRYE